MIERFLTRHHDHLAAWLSAGSPESLDAFLAAHHETFTLVTTDGSILDLKPLREALRGAGGTRPGLSIRLENITTITPGARRFLEHHIVDGSLVDARVVTALTQNGLLLAVQETDRHPVRRSAT